MHSARIRLLNASAKALSVGLPGREKSSEATAEVLALTASELRAADIIIELDLEPDLPAARGDRVQLQQVIVNLILNAVAAMRGIHDRPRIFRIATARDTDDHVRLSVCDAGVGIEAADLDRLFEPFFTTKPDGMGIGLSISRTIVEAHEGRLWAENNGQRRGSTFWFSIPAQMAISDGPNAALEIR